MFPNREANRLLSHNVNDFRLRYTDMLHMSVTPPRILRRPFRSGWRYIYKLEDPGPCPTRSTFLSARRSLSIPNAKTASTQVFTQSCSSLLCNVLFSTSGFENRAQWETLPHSRSTHLFITGECPPNVTITKQNKLTTCT